MEEFFVDFEFLYIKENSSQISKFSRRKNSCRFKNCPEEKKDFEVLQNKDNPLQILKLYRRKNAAATILNEVILVKQEALFKLLIDNPLTINSAL